MNDADRADLQQTEILEANLGNRKRFTKWDRKPRDCSVCDNPIPDARLEAINPTECVHCAD